MTNTTFQTQSLTDTSKNFIKINNILIISIIKSVIKNFRCFSTVARLYIMGYTREDNLFPHVKDYERLTFRRFYSSFFHHFRYPFSTIL